MLESLKRETFAAELNTRFRVRLDAERALELELTEVTDQDSRRPQGFESFSIIFRGPLESFLPQSTYELEHERLGTFPLFIVPIRQSPQGIDYQAVFNRQTT